MWGRRGTGGQEALPAQQEEGEGEAACLQKFWSQLPSMALPTCTPRKASPLQKWKRAPLLFMALSVNQSCQFPLVLHKGEFCGSHK